MTTLLEAPFTTQIERSLHGDEYIYIAIYRGNRRILSFHAQNIMSQLIKAIEKIKVKKDTQFKFTIPIFKLCTPIVYDERNLTSEGKGIKTFTSIFFIIPSDRNERQQLIDNLSNLIIHFSSIRTPEDEKYKKLKLSYALPYNLYDTNIYNLENNITVL